MQAIELIDKKDMSHEKWLSWRDKGLGGSDASVICGLNKWKSQMELWMEKTGQKEPKKAGEAAYWGNVMEPIIREEFSYRTGFEVKPVNSILRHPEYEFILANLDGFIKHPEYGQGIFEAKTANAFMASQWEVGIPEIYEVQLQHYFSVTGLDYGFVAVLLGGNSFKYHFVPRNDKVIESLIKLETYFWDLVQTDSPPEIDGSQASSELLKDLYPEGKASSRLELPEEASSFLDEFEAAKAEEAEAKQRKEGASNKLKEMLGEYETGTINGRKISWKTTNSKRFNSKEFKSDHPDLFEKYEEQSSYRRFSVK